jgi:hypothetical protein
MKNNIFIVTVILLLSILFIISDWITEKNKNQNNQCIMGGDIKKVEGIVYGGCYDWWHVSHFVLWLIIGMLVPHKYILVFIISFSWDWTEHCFFK